MLLIHHHAVIGLSLVVLMMLLLDLPLHKMLLLRHVMLHPLLT